MKSAVDICALDYLIGTIATAYKGVITSLVIKDFCMTEEDDSVTLRGTILSMPEGEYQASLIESGMELWRTAIEKGYFEFKVGGGHVKKAGDLQIDVLQNGRHIGTFLLKKEHADGFYTPAVELSDDMKGVDFKRLTSRLQNKVGLLRRAEDIISKLLSTKKDWGKISETLDSLSMDLFWSARDAFYDAYDIFVRFSLHAAEKAGAGVSAKPVSNFLDLIELPLERESDRKRLRFAADRWLGALRETSLDYSSHPGRFLKAFAALRESFPDAGIQPLVKSLLTSLKARIMKTPVLSETVLDSVKGFVSPRDFSLFRRYTEAGKKKLVERLASLEGSVEKGEYKRFFEGALALQSDLPDDAAMVTAFFNAGMNMTGESAETFMRALLDMAAISAALSQRAYEAVAARTPGMIGAVIARGRPDLCGMLLTDINAGPYPLKDEIVMNQATAVAVLGSHNRELVEKYSAILRHIVIPAGNVKGISSETWAAIVNPLHLERLSKFLDILQLGREGLREVLVHVVANLYVSGVFIPDDRLFQRSVSSYLNSDALRGDFLLNYLLLEKLPVYYNEVGAASTIRDYTTEIDSWGNDPALYFLRKQVHVNASNYNIRLIEKVISSWVNNDPALLKDSVPPDVYAGLDTELLAQYSSAVRPFFELTGVLDARGLHFEKLLSLSEEAMRSALRETAGNDEVRRKILLLSRIYQEVVKKYALMSRDFVQRDVSSALAGEVGKVAEFKKTVLSPEKTAARESLYFKRHIAFGIPSVLGSYHEPKFDALGGLLRSDAKIRVILEETISEIEKKGKAVSTGDVTSWVCTLEGVNELMKLHGIDNFRINELVTVLANNRLRMTQVVDLLRMWQKELAWMVRFFNRTFHGPIKDILEECPRNELPEILMNLDPSENDFEDKAADILIRDIISSVPGLVEADRIINALINALTRHIEHAFDAEVYAGTQQREADDYFMIDELPDDEAVRLGPVIGSKIENLVYLRSRGFPVPAGAVFSALHTGLHREYTDSVEFYTSLRQAVKKIEERSGGIFGGRERPLFLSVRSGSHISMPGILSSLLYCGMNSVTVQALMNSTGDPRFAWDSYRRFIEHYGTIVYGLDAAVFENILQGVMKKRNTHAREELAADDMETVVALYKHKLSERKLEIPGDVYEQLRRAVRAVYASWFSERAVQFKRATKTSDHWGTSVALMQMVFGNAAGSGASVFFTRNPFTYEEEIYGETAENATGDDLVYGMRANRPLSRKQSEKTGNILIAEGGERHRAKSLEEVDPELFQMHRELARAIEQAFGGLPQEVEVTYVRQRDGKRALFVLQTRRMEFSANIAVKFGEICRMESRIIGRGIGANGGALSGAVSFAASALETENAKRKSGMPVVLLRRTASTGDVSLMPLISGIITSQGGVTSHAAVLAQKFGVTAVVSCADMSIDADEQGPYARIGAEIVREGAPLSIDGSTGLIFSGTCLYTV